MATASQPSTQRPSLGLFAALCALAAGCGEPDRPPTQREQIETAVKRVLESEAIADQCETGVSERFVREVYVTLAQCRRANQPAASEDDPPDTARVSATRIDGAKATTAVTLTSVKGARATGRVALVRVGETWKVDRLGVDFLRSVFGTLPAQAETAAERHILRCLAEGTRALSDREVRRVGNVIIGDRLQAASLPDGIVRCIRGRAPSPQEREQATAA